MARFDDSAVTARGASSRLLEGADALARRIVLAKADEGELTERRHGAALGNTHARRAGGPAGIALPGELGAPAELARRGGEPMLQRAAQSGFGADPAQQHDLTARLHHASELVQRALGI